MPIPRFTTNSIDFGDGWSIVKSGDSLSFRRFGVERIRLDATGLGLLGATPAAAVTVTQTDATAEATLAADTVTSIAAAVPSAVGDLGATEETGGGAWGYSSEANADAVHTTIDSLITHSTEIDLDLERLIVDVRDLKSAFNTVVDALQAHGTLA